MKAKIMDNKEKDIVEAYYSLIKIAIDKHGVYPHHLIVESDDGGWNACALDIATSEAMTFLVSEFKAGPAKLICGFDRTCLSNQGTTLGDCVAGHYWDGVKWSSFVIEYQENPRIVKPIDWDNKFWNEQLARERTHLGL